MVSLHGREKARKRRWRRSRPRRRARVSFLDRFKNLFKQKKQRKSVARNQRRIDRAWHHPAVTALIAMFAAVGVITFYQPAQPAPVAPFAPSMHAGPSMNAF